RSIGAGTYGSVYHARLERQEIAIKQFYITIADASSDSAIQQEVQLLASLSDKHIIQVYGTTEHEGRLALLMECAEGGNLEAAIQDRRLDWPDRTRIAQEVARGLNYIHHKNVLHRDLKSTNVLLTHDRRMEVKLCDIGLATVKTRSASMSTLPGENIHHWMAPELLTDTPKYSTKSDMFALGILMWEMAANYTVPLKDKDSHTKAIEPESSARMALLETMPPKYRHWVERCCEHDPDKRPQASEMVAMYSEPETTSAGEPETTSAGEPETTSASEPETTSAIQAQGAAAGNSPSSIRIVEETNDGVSKPINDVGPLLTRANAGDVGAQVALAAKYESGISVDQSDTEAFKWYLRAARLGSTTAQYKIGSFSLTGRGTVRNDTIGVFWLQRAAEGAHIFAQNELGWIYQNDRGVEHDDKEALSRFLISAVQGDPMAQCNLGLLYQSGLGGKQDSHQALAWFRKAANQGDPYAQNSLGWMYQKGHAVERDPVQALVWYGKAAAQENAQAQNSLGLIYRKGLGVEQNHVEAVSWFRKAADQAQSAVDPRQRMGIVNAQFNLGLAYWYGWGVEQDDTEALSWCRKAAEQGHRQAQFHLGSMYIEGRGVDQSGIKAVSWWQKAAAQGDADSQYSIGQADSTRRGVGENA
ncbi:hypothetical protein DFQ26_000359, partial [Actinomortierella ambigua]